MKINKFSRALFHGCFVCLQGFPRLYEFIISPIQMTPFESSKLTRTIFYAELTVLDPLILGLKNWYYKYIYI